MQLVLDLDVWNHLAANLAEARETVSDRQETVLFYHRNVPGRVPSVA